MWRCNKVDVQHNTYNSPLKFVTARSLSQKKIKHSLITLNTFLRKRSNRHKAV